MTNSYQKTNNALGWLSFFIATVTYVLTLEPSVSFWDCGEFIASAFRMQVVHQPGAPLFLMIQKMFSLLAFGDVNKVAYFMNFGSAVCSGFTILFLFWTITALAKKVVAPKGEMNTSQMISIMGAGLVGALAYTFSDTFWYSAVESEVYAQSSMATALVVWLIFKWETHADEARSDKWILLIAYIMGLSIGIHLLNLLTIPALVMVYYFRKSDKVTNAGIFKFLGIGIVILAVIQYGIIQYTIKGMAYFDLFFVNVLGMGFGAGIFAFFILVIAGITWGILYSIKHQKHWLNLALLSVTFILMGYSSFTMIVVRAKAKTNLNNSNPDNAFSFQSYLDREQYGQRPLFNGQNFNSKPIDVKYGATLWRKGKDKYEEDGKKFSYVYDNKVLLPRMYDSESNHPQFYQQWMNLGPEESPNLFKNIGFLLSYQTNFMYMRYFMWNFVGRFNGNQGYGNEVDGQWFTGLNILDKGRVGDKSTFPPVIQNDDARNQLFALPLILGLLGIIWHFKRNQKDAGIVALLFFFTGVAIVLYLNQTPNQPRERDYAYVGSFYAFCIWVGLGVIYIQEFLQKKLSPKMAASAATLIGLLAAPILMAQQEWDDHDRSTNLIAHDSAVNYLNSCAPNAILFCYGDNDTYPVWYAQEVEGVRPDVRVINLSLFDSDWYLNDVQRKANTSEPIDLHISPDKYAGSTRSIIRYHDFKVQQALDLKEVLAMITSDDKDNQFQMNDGTYENVLPTRNFKIPVNPNEVIAAGVLPASLKSQIVDSIVFKFKGDQPDNAAYVTKGNLGMLSILAYNNWKRPIYFTSAMPPSQHNGLDEYLYDIGMVQQLLPLKKGSFKDNVYPPYYYHNVMNQYKWGNAKTMKHIDAQVGGDQVMSMFNGLFSTLTQSLIDENHLDSARKVLKKYEEVMPQNRFFNLRSTLSRLYIAKCYYELNESQKGNALMMGNIDFLSKQLKYFSTLSNDKGYMIDTNDFQLSLQIMAMMAQIADQNKQIAIYQQIETALKPYQSYFSQR